MSAMAIIASCEHRGRYTLRHLFKISKLQDRFEGKELSLVTLIWDRN
jgi:hypothetical protein